MDSKTLQRLTVINQRISDRTLSDGEIAMLRAERDKLLAGQHKLGLNRLEEVENLVKELTAKVSDLAILVHNLLRNIEAPKGQKPTKPTKPKTPAEELLS